jgi:hypothetical protein
MHSMTRIPITKFLLTCGMTRIPLERTHLSKLIQYSQLAINWIR